MSFWFPAVTPARSKGPFHLKAFSVSLPETGVFVTEALVLGPVPLKELFSIR